MPEAVTGFIPLANGIAAPGALRLQRLRDAGVTVTASHYTGLIHGFFRMAGGLESGRQLIAENGQRAPHEA